MDGYKVSQLEWEQIRQIMLFYGRKDGYVDVVNGKLQFFDSDPKIDGVGACYVTIEDVCGNIESAKNANLAKDLEFTKSITLDKENAELRFP